MKFFRNRAVFFVIQFERRVDTPEFIRLISGQQTAIYSYILSLHPNRVDAEDILQETNVVLWQKISEFEPGTNFRAWAFKVAYFQVLAHRQRVQRRPVLELDEPLLECLAADAAKVFEDLEDRQRALKFCVTKLARSDAEILGAHYEKEQPLAEIARAIGRSQGAIKQALLRIRRALRVCITRQMASAGTIGG
jgi:RNA polymerase sigma-70 factor (ECF subfamily)